MFLIFKKGDVVFFTEERAAVAEERAPHYQLMGAISFQIKRLLVRHLLDAQWSWFSLSVLGSLVLH